MQTKGEYTPGPWRVGADLIRVHPGWRDEHGNARADCLHRNGYAKTIAAVGKEDGDWVVSQFEISFFHVSPCS